jgi:hypothetical protein
MKETMLNAAERRLVAAVRAGDELDLSASPEEERTLRASVLREILLGGVRGEPGQSGLRLRGAVVEGDLDLSDVPASMTLDLTKCQVARICRRDANPVPIAGKSDAPGRGWPREVSSLPGRISMGQYLTALLFAFVVIKVVWIARGDIPTALGVFDSAGLATVIVGGLLSTLPLISAVALGWAAFQISRHRSSDRKFLHDTSAWLWLSAAAGACFFLTPWPWPRYVDYVAHLKSKATR